jgi:hypothetical protein
MKKNTFLWILVALVVFFFVFGMGKSVYEGFVKFGGNCTSKSSCDDVPGSNGRTYYGICSKSGKCSKGGMKPL